MILDRSKELSTYNQSGDAWLVHKYMKFRKPLVVEYNAGVAGTIADISTNSLYMVFLGDHAANYPALAGYCRIRYTDM